MNALAMPISSRIAADMDWVCFCANSPRILEERSATCWTTLPSSCASFWLAGCIPHDAICPRRPLCLARVVKIVQVGYRLAHGEESLVRIERPAKQHRQELAGAALVLLQLRHELGVAVAAARHRLRPRVVEPVAPEHRQHGLRRVPGGARAHGVSRQVFALRRPELHAEAPAQPVRVAGVVGVIVREDDAPDGLEALEELVPQRARLSIADTGVDDGPTAF